MSDYAAEFRDYVTSMSLLVPTVLLLYNTYQAHQTQRNMLRLETNTNSKMDALLEAKDAAAAAQVGEAAATGKAEGRAAEKQESLGASAALVTYTADRAAEGLKDVASAAAEQLKTNQGG